MKHLNRAVNLISFRTFLIVILLITGTIQFLFMLNNVKSVTYDIEPYQLAPDTIRAVKTIEDTEKTEEERKKAETQVEPVYQFNEEIAAHRVAFVSSIFNAVQEVKNNKNLEKKPISDQVTALRQKFQELTENHSNLIFSSAELEALLKADTATLNSTKSYIEKLIGVQLAEPIREDKVADVRSDVERELINNLNVQSTLLNASVTIGKAAVTETEIVDEVKTKERVTKARESVEPIRILQGQIIVQEGELVDQETYRQLELLGLTKNHTSIKPVIGLAIFIFIQMVFIYAYFHHTKMQDGKKRNALLVTCIIYLISIIMMEVITLLADKFDENIAFVYPTALCTMLVCMLASEKIAIFVTVLTASSAGIIFQEGYSAVMQMDIALYILFGGLSSLAFVRNMEKRNHISKASGIVALTNLLFILFYLLMSQSSFSLMECAFYGAVAILSGLFSGALTIGLLPFFESVFGIVSTMKLIELSNPNHPLLKKILTETPGTYHHSIMVANLAEAACEAIDADGLLARVGCYYHDIGKTKRPAFFVENQISGINPHDSLPPERSAEIIIAHTTDGAEILAKNKIPREIIDITLQHHGTSSLKFFIHKAKESGEPFDESKFYYPGPKPQTREAAVVSIADSVEAAVRSMNKPTPEKIRELVHNIVQGKLKEDQFDECDISFKELKTIENVLCETLNGTFHNRIEYPKVEN